MKKIQIIFAISRAGIISPCLSPLYDHKGFADQIPNKEILIYSLTLQEAKDSSEIENIITTQDELFEALAIESQHISENIKEVLNYRTAHIEVALDVERHVAAKYLKELEKIGILTSQKRSRIILYINSKLYALLGEGIW